MSNGFGPTNIMSEILSSRYRIYIHRNAPYCLCFFRTKLRISTNTRSFCIKTLERIQRFLSVLTTCLTGEIIMKQYYYYCYNFQQKPNVTIQQGFLRYPIEDFSTQLTLLTHNAQRSPSILHNKTA